MPNCDLAFAFSARASPLQRCLPIPARLSGPLNTRCRKGSLRGQSPPIGSTERRKKPGPTFHYTGWLIGILTMVYYNPFITG